MVNSQTDSSHSETRLDCQQIEERIHGLLDQRRSPLEDPVVKEHSAHCRQCGDLIADFAALGDSLLGLPVSTLQRGSPFNPWVLVASIAALLLVMLTSNVWLSDFDVSEGAFEVAAIAVVTPPALDMSEPARPFSLFEITEIAEIVEIKEIAEIVEVVALADSAISSEGLLNPVRFERFGNQVESCHEYLGVAAELPGIEPIRNSVNLALQFISTISRAPVDKKPVKSLPGGLQVGAGDPISFFAYA